MERKLNIVIAGPRMVQKTLSGILQEREELCVADCPQDGRAAVRSVAENRPGLLLMTLGLPHMNGREVLAEVMSHHPTPVIVVDDQIAPESAAAQELIDLGALTVIQRPALFCDPAEFEVFSERLIYWSLRAGKAKVVRLLNLAESRAAASAAVAVTADARGGEAAGWHEPASRGEAAGGRALKDGQRVVLIGSSTGGPTALASVLSQLPGDFPLPIVVAQHMPKGFTTDLARHLNSICQITVRESADQDWLEPGVALFAPGRSNMRFDSAASVRLEWPEAPLGYTPSIDTLFNSAAKHAGTRAMAVVLTGMGNDGSQGVRRIKEAGGMVVSQDEVSSMIFGMPKAAIATGCTDVIADLDGIAAQIRQFSQEQE